MKKKIMSLALAAATVLSFGASAQNAVNESGHPAAKTENIQRNKCDKERKMRNPYEGLTLSDTQKDQLSRLDESRKAEMRQRKEARKAEKASAKDGKKKLSAEEKQARRAEKVAAKKKYLEDVKAIVGPEQYVVFLENAYMHPVHKAKMGKKGGKDRKDFKADGRSFKEGKGHKGGKGGKQS